MAKSNAIYWLRNDLRLSDNQTLCAAAKNYRVLFLFVHAPEEEGHWTSGAASLFWLHNSLKTLSESLQERFAARLLLRRGPAHESIADLAKQTSATTLFFSKRYEPWARLQEQKVIERMNEERLDVHSFDSTVLFSPDKVFTQEGNPYKVFTPYWKNVSERSVAIGQPLKAPVTIDTSQKLPKNLSLNSLGLLPKVDWAQGIHDVWRPGEVGAHLQLKKFLRRVDDYAEGRNRPDKEHVSRLSPHLHFGEISPRTVWYAVERHREMDGQATKGCEAYLRELGWREFATHLLYHFPKTTDRPLREEFSKFPWSNDKLRLRAWQEGQTGYPIVDAGMRQLLTTGWMHNRVRMVVASFLVKDLRISWQEGARWFWDTLVDADLANNTLGWQWSAGCGADAAPYFRIFNPVLQGQRFDPDGHYIRHWVPELAQLSNKWIHSPWKAPQAVLKDANVKLGVTYPEPLIAHALARSRALEALASITTRTSKQNKATFAKKVNDHGQKEC